MLTSAPIRRVLPPGCTYALAPGVELFANGLLSGGAPYRVMRLSPPARDGLERVLLASEAAHDPRIGRFACRLVDVGVLTPSWQTSTELVANDITVVIPVRDRPHDLDDLLGDLVGFRSIVVDDASDEPSAIARVCARHGAELLELASSGGPGSARNAGLALVDTAVALLIDSDCRLPDGWLDPLLPHFNDPAVAAVAPRIRGPQANGVIARFEHDASPLDLGSQPATVRPGSLVSYVPTAALLVRTAVGTTIFDESLRLGEDVDLVWRLVDHGWSVRYEPSVTVSHAARSSIGPWIRQRYLYGTSAAPLEERHGDAAAPLSGSAWTMGIWGTAALGAPVVSTALLGGVVAQVRRRLSDVVDDPTATAWRLGVGGTWRAGPALARQVIRSYAPALGIAALTRRGRRAALATVLIAGVSRWRRSDRSIDPVRFVALSTLDDVAYGAGVWRGAARARRTGSLRPRVVFGSRVPRVVQTDDAAVKRT